MKREATLIIFKFSLNTLLYNVLGPSYKYFRLFWVDLLTILGKCSGNTNGIELLKYKISLPQARMLSEIRARFSYNLIVFFLHHLHSDTDFIEF